SSGISVEEQCLTAFSRLKDSHEYKYVLFKIASDNKSIIVDTTSSGPYVETPEDVDAAKKALKEKTEEVLYEEFVALLPEDECRYAVYDLAYVKDGQRNKILFYAWAPEVAPIRNKMIYASSKDALRKMLVGVAEDIQATDLDEASHDTVLEKVMRHVR
ncbi:cofilin, partial [Coemansia thaxteri]